MNLLKLNYKPKKSTIIFLFNFYKLIFLEEIKHNENNINSLQHNTDKRTGCNSLSRVIKLHQVRY